ncbi:MAG: DNA (cytosine-5-)-methyltransferase [Candidatus Wolfebacteria bacterium]|nr:DNA (cytosine-5-)-methyltransferase [Candidatus Wolfebacteria bacterium]
MFSGIGGFEIPMQELNWECVGFSEIDKYATQIYKKHFPTHSNFGDATRIIPEQLPDFDLLCGGFPCQAFSIAGKRGGFEDTRGTLFFEIAKITRVKRPRYLFLENVKGLLSHDEGNTFATIISAIDEMGYDCQWQVLNSNNINTPQVRERVFIIGHLRGTPRPKVFPIHTRTGTTNEKQISERFRTNIKPIFKVSDPESTRRDIANRHSIRDLTPIEYERAQGFPDNWTKYGFVECLKNKVIDIPWLDCEDCCYTHCKTQDISDTQRYKCLGNAVTVNVIREIVCKII